MEAVIKVRDARQEALREHPFFAWLRSRRVPVDRQLDFAPAAALFIAQFRDMNLWALSYPEPSDEYQWVITRGTLEDRKHFRMFVDDWRLLGLDERLGWRASDMLWWLFVSDEQEPMRQAGMRFLRFAVDDGGNPFIRFGHSGAGEAAGHVFLSHSAPIADALAKATGRDYRYFGTYHLDLETGHVGNKKGLFEARVLEEPDRAAALFATEGMFKVFEDVFTCWLDYAERYVETGSTPIRPARQDVAVRYRSVPPASLNLEPFYDYPHSARIAWTLNARRARAAAHPFYRWLQASSEMSPRDRLCTFVPLWTMDILGYRDLARYALSYPDPQSEAEHAINRWAAELSTHSRLFLDDWDSLALDDRLGFGASDTLEYLFLDPDLDGRRQHRIEFAKLAMRYEDPALRWWLMTALEATGEAFFAHTRPLAEAVESEFGVRLDYLAGRHCADLAAKVRPGRPPSPLRAEDEDVAIGLVNTVFDALETNLTLSYAAARADRFGVGSHVAVSA